MAQITLTNGAIALIDDEDLAMVSRWSWKQHRARYAYRTVRNGKGWKNVYLHQLLIGPPPEGMEVDHENRNRLDNRRPNLRFLPHWKNSHNRDTGRPTNSGHRGIGKPKGRTRWSAILYAKNRIVWRGNFKTLDEAVIARAAAALALGV